MAWIKVESPTPSKPEVLRIARIMGITPDDAFGKAMRFWLWLDGVSVDGRVDGLAPHDVDAVLNARDFCNALMQVGWLEYDAQNECLIVPHFDRHNGESAKARALRARRQAKWRQKSVDGRVDSVASTSASTREEKRREDINTPIVPKGTDAAFDAFWQSVHIKTGKEAARRAFTRAVKRMQHEGIQKGDAEVRLLDRMAAFARSPQAHPKDRSPIHPATWLNQGRYDDDPAAWEGNGHEVNDTQPFDN